MTLLSRISRCSLTFQRRDPLLPPIVDGLITVAFGGKRGKITVTFTAYVLARRGVDLQKFIGTASLCLLHSTLGLARTTPTDGSLIRVPLQLVKSVVVLLPFILQTFWLQLMVNGCQFMVLRLWGYLLLLGMMLMPRVVS